MGADWAADLGADWTTPPLTRAPSRPDPAGRFPFTPYPTGWYRVSASRDLSANQVRALRCFGRDLVLFRPNAGPPAVLDAHCPHLGAHLGHGGRVVDGALACPFHHWRFGAGGQCVGVPGATAVPSRARLRAWPVREACGAIMLWFDEAGRAPLWEVPLLPECRAPGWTPLRPARGRLVATHVQELAENGVDLAHFSAIHGGQVGRIESDGLEIDGATLTHRMRNGFTRRIGRRTKLLGAADGAARMPGRLSFTYHGLGTMVCRAHVAGRLAVSFLTVLYFTPLDENRVQVSGELAITKCGLLTAPLMAIARREAERAIDDDTAVLENKRYLPRPLLSQADGPIMQYRGWAKQFFPVTV
jgi:phenylpropionate dioxygenase-like ring-hydroxylating dioxygenase large terminal subunit